MIQLHFAADTAWMISDLPIPRPNLGQKYAGIREAKSAKRDSSSIYRG